MDLSTLRSAPGARRKRKRIGRGPGSGSGKTSGRGHKGQKSRSGYSRKFGFEGGQMPLNRRLPKRGFNHMKRHAFAIINIDTLDQVFDAGAEVTSGDIVRKGLAPAAGGGVKVLGRGEITKQLNLTVHAISPSAKSKIEAAGGTVDLVERPKYSTRKADDTAEKSPES